MKYDILKNRYHSDEELFDYCYLAASTVGLICIHIFGFNNIDTINYAINLGKALQMTNIIRDVYQDMQINRIYIPLIDLEKFNVTEKDIKEKKYNDNFISLMKYQNNKAESFYKLADSFLSKDDKKSMIVAEMMGNIYHSILKKIERKSFNIFNEKIKINHFTKISILFRTLISKR